MCAPTVLVRCTLDEFMVLTCGLQRPRAPTGSGTWTSHGQHGHQLHGDGPHQRHGLHVPGAGGEQHRRKRCIHRGDRDAFPDPDPEPEPEPVPALPLLGQLLLALVLRNTGAHCRLARMAGAWRQTRTVRCMVRVIHGFSRALLRNWLPTQQDRYWLRRVQSRVMSRVCGGRGGCVCAGARRTRPRMSARRACCI